tara:strand:- start:167 stop:544 length:378 start_codon:yes stop_codon:yes gene_type:complete
MTTNKSHYTIATQWIVPEDMISEVEQFFQEHEKWMRETHNLSGDAEPRIVDYSVSKAPQYIDNDLEKGPSGKMIYSLYEAYVTDQGAMKHFELWQSHPGVETMAKMSEYQSDMSFNAEVIATMEK